MENKREKGFYWCKFLDRNDKIYWEIGLYDPEYNNWMFCGVGSSFIDSEILDIDGQKIEKI